MTAVALAPYLEARASERLKQLSLNLRRVRRNPGNPDSIHDLRVSIRRLAQFLRTFQDLFDARQVRKMRRQLRQVMDQCAAVRNCDIGIDVLAAAGAPMFLYRAFLRRRSAAERELAALLGEWRRRRVTRHWRTWVTSHSLRPSPAAKARAILPGMARALFLAGAAAARPGANAQKMHEFRLLAKRFRYSLELFEGLYGEEWKQGLVELRALQDRLGGISDCSTTRALLDSGPTRSAAYRRSRGSVGRLLKKRVEEFRHFWQTSFTPAHRAWWLRWLKGIEG